VTWCPAVPELRLANSHLSLVVMTNPRLGSLKWMVLCSDVHKLNIQVPETGIGFFAIPIKVLAGTPAGPPSAPRRHAEHQVRGIARQQGPRGQGPS